VSLKLHLTQVLAIVCSYGRAPRGDVSAAWRALVAAAVGVVLLALLGGLAPAETVAIVDQHPRLVFRPIGTPGARTFQDVRDLYNFNGGNNPFKQEVDTWLSGGPTTYIDQASRYVVTGNPAYAESALDSLYAASLSYGGTESSFAGAQWALAYDWIHDAWEGGSPPANLQTKLGYIEGQIAGFVDDALDDLDSCGPSLWHGRAALGAVAWVGSLALPVGNPTYESFRTRAWSHWQQSLKAIHASGGWPEGPTYWATNRAVNFPLAQQCYTSAVTAAPALAVDDPVEDLRQLGLWQLYSERGDGSFNRYGDVSSQVRISNGTMGKSIDYYAMATGDPALAAFAAHARDYRWPLYYSGYRWLLPVTYDPYIPKPPGYNQAEPAECLADALPNAAIFGDDAMGFVVMRQGWSAGDTQISFKAGDYLAHHGHCDQGTFTIYKHAPLVINSGGYGPYFGVHRLNYYVRTVSTNSLLIQRPDEAWTPPSVPPPGGFVNDGGQRIVQATGSSVTSYENWLANKTAGWNYELADITAFDNADEDYTYVASDLTRAYNSTLYDSEGQGGKVSLVTRQMVYLQDADVLVVFDRVNSTDAAYKKKWLLHTPNKFVGGAETVVRGSAEDGIMTVDGQTIADDVLTMTNGEGKLFLQVLLPESYSVNKVGGPNHRYYVENDGDDSDGYDGTNHDDYDERDWHDYGDWRIEISPNSPACFDTFLNVLSPRHASAGSVDLAAVLPSSPEATVMQVAGHVLGFGVSGSIGQGLSYSLPGAGTFQHLLVDLTPGGFYKITGEDGYQFATANDAGLVVFTDSATGPHDVTVLSVLADPPPGDATRDGIVDGADYTIWADHYNSPGTWDEGDFSGDNWVNGADYTIWADNYSGEDAIAEPLTVIFVAVGAVGLFRRRSRVPPRAHGQHRPR